jgi:hypothetical protein
MREDDADVIALLWQAGTDDPDLLAGWREVNATRWDRVSEIAACLGWSRKRWEEWLATTLTTLLLREHPLPAGTRSGCSRPVRRQRRASA